MKKDLTLVELFTIIFIMIIFILISLPLILNEIGKYNKSEAIDIAYKYIEKIEDEIVLKKVKEKIIVKDGEYDNLEKFEKTNKIQIDGKRPTIGTFKLKKGIIISSKFVINDYIVNCDKKECKIGEKIKKITSNVNDIEKPQIVKDNSKKEENKKEKEDKKEKESTKKDNTKKTSSGKNDISKEKTNNTKIDEPEKKYTITLENAKFSDGTTSKVLNSGEEIEITAIIPDNYVEDNYSGITTCSSSSDAGKTRYKVKHEYSIENWNVSNKNSNTIKYKVVENKNIKANIKEVKSEVEKYRCDSTGAGYQNAYYNCPSGGSLSGSRCYYTGSYVANCTTYMCSGCCRGYTGGHGPNHDQFEWSDVDCEQKSCSCPSGGSESNGMCYYSSSYAATYHRAYYYCSGGWSLNGSTCYKWTGV